jgi:hypothetical protein
VLIIGLAVAWARSRQDLGSVRRLAVDHRLGGPAALAAAIVASWTVAAAGAVDRTSALAEAARILLFFVFWGLTVVIAAKDERFSERLGWVASSLIALQLALFAAGIVNKGFGTTLFEHIGSHSVLGTLPRFRGLAEHPMACGSATLLLVGLAAGLPGSARIVRFGAIGAGFVVVAATLSFATLTLPAAAVFTLPKRSVTRALGLIVASFVALAALWFNPLRLEVAGHILLERQPVPGYMLENNGPAFMPIHTIQGSGLRLDFHLTGYALLALRSLSCAREHPLGVGGRNFVHSCPVMAMNTFGGWTSSRGAHNAYGALLAEGGLLTTLVTAALVVVVLRRLHGCGVARLPCGIVLAYLLAGAGGASPFQFPFAALLAVFATRCRQESKGSDYS